MLEGILVGIIDASLLRKAMQSCSGVDSGTGKTGATELPCLGAQEQLLTGEAPTVRVIEAPRSGMLAVREAQLTTDKIAGCPALKTPAQVVFYTANTDYAGPDHVKYEVKDENGEVATYDMTITVKAVQPGQNPPTGTPAPQPQ